MKRWTGLPVLVLAVGVGCSDAPTAPTPSESVTIQGQVINADRDIPVPDAVVSTDWVCYPGGCGHVTDPTQVTGDAKGNFVLSTSLPASWTEVRVTVVRTGFDPVRQYVQRANVSSARLTAYPTLTLWFAESIRVNVVSGVEVCGALLLNCRRVAVVVPASGAVDVEVTGDDGPLGLSLDGKPLSATNHPTVQTVSRREVWILGVGSGTLRSREPAVINEVASIQGQVLDADSRTPIAGAAIATDSVCYPGRCARVDNPIQVIADGNGDFTLTTTLPMAWQEVMLKITRHGYEPQQQYVQRAHASSARLTAYPTLTIRPGESIRVDLAQITGCGWLSINCRRIAVVLPASGVVEIEVAGDGRYLGLSPDGDPFTDNKPPAVLSVSRNEVWILGDPETVTLTARER